MHYALWRNCKRYIYTESLSFSLLFLLFSVLFTILPLLPEGKYPVEAVDVVSKIALEAEAAMFHRSMFDEMCKLTPTPTNTVQTTAIAAVNASFQQHAAAIVTVTVSGK